MPTTDMPMSDQGLKATGYAISIPKFPDIAFQVQSVKIPDVTLGVAMQPNPEQDIAHPGNKLTFDPLTVSMFCDETLVAHTKLFGWMRNLSTFTVPSADMALLAQRFGLSAFDQHEDMCDVSVTILDSKNNPVATYTFVDAFPTLVGGWVMDASDTGHSYLKFDVQFTYTYFRVDQATSQ